MPTNSIISLKSYSPGSSADGGTRCMRGNSETETPIIKGPESNDQFNVKQTEGADEKGR